MSLRGILAGMASILEIQPPEPPRPRRAAKRKPPKRPISDAEAIARDWLCVGQDLQAALAQHRRSAA